jgi:diguanylate cyclase (GGDEF)-like protein
MLLLCAIFPTLHAQELSGGWREVRPGDTPEQVLSEFREGHLPSFSPARLQSFPTQRDGAWVVLQMRPPYIASDRVLHVDTPPAGAVSLYLAGHAPVRMALDDFSNVVHGHGRLAFAFAAEQRASDPILLKFEAARSMPSPVTFRMQPWPDYLDTDAGWLVFATTCFAVMLAMAAMALCFALMLRDMLFAWYAGYLVCYVLIQATQTGFIYHPLELQFLAGMGAVISGATVAISVSFAAIFLLRFAEIRQYAPLLRVPILSLAFGMPLVALARLTGIEVLVSTSQVLTGPLLILGSALLLLASVIAAVRGSRYAWFFLVGWTPLLALTSLRAIQVSGLLTDAFWLSDAPLVAGAFEAVVLSIGLADRALILRRDRDRAQVLADNDALTGVLNRRAWNEGADALLASSPPRPLSVLFLDLDHFKELNDCQGHAAGDRALIAVADALRAELRPGDLLGRYGGEEFVALLDGVDADNAVHVAVRLCRRVHRLELNVGTSGNLLTVSIGVAMRNTNDSVDDLIERADAAMYAAKLAGRNRVMLETQLRPAVNRRRPAAQRAVQQE